MGTLTCFTGFIVHVLTAECHCPFIYLFIYSFIHYATEAAHITLQTYKIKHSIVFLLG